MQDPASELRRTPLPRTPVNKGMEKEPGRYALSLTALLSCVLAAAAGTTLIESVCHESTTPWRADEALRSGNQSRGLGDELHGSGA